MVLHFDVLGSIMKTRFLGSLMQLWMALLTTVESPHPTTISFIKKIHMVWVEMSPISETWQTEFYINNCTYTNRN